MANSKKRRKLIVFAVLGLVITALALAAVFRKRDAAISIQTDKVKRRDLTEIVVANGRIQPITQVVISPEVAGEIIQLPVKEGMAVNKGDLLVQVKQDNYLASRNSAEASYKSALAGKTVAQTELVRAEAEFKRNEELFRNKLVSDSVFMEFQTAYEVSKLRFETSVHQADQAKFGLDKAKDDLSKTTIYSPIEGTITRLKSQLGERVLGTSFNMGTEIMTVADLSAMEARVDIGEIDVVLIQPGQRARLEVDAFKDRKFTGVVTEIANSSRASGTAQMTSQTQEGTKFEVRIRINEKESFRPGMSISAEIETRYRTNVLTVPYAALTTRLPKPANSGTNNPAATGANVAGTNVVASSPAATNSAAGTNDVKADKKGKEAAKAIEVVFVVDGDKVKQLPVKKGISDADYWEIESGLTEGQEVVMGNYKAVNRELEDGKKITKGGAVKPEDKDKK
jgi:HlyD family secretion protein